MKRKIFNVIWILFITGCSNNVTADSNEFNYFVPEMFEYTDVDYLHIKWNEIFDQPQDKYFVYFYSPTCSHCNEIKNQIIKIALDRTDIYFVKGSNLVQIKNDVKDTIGAGIAGDFYILGYPSLAKICYKKVAINVAGKSNILSLLD